MKEDENTGEISIWPQSGEEISKQTSKPVTPKERNDSPEWIKTSKSLSENSIKSKQTNCG